MHKNFLLVAAIFGFLGVAFGAFGAHGLRNRVSPEMLAVFEIGVRYQMYHVFALLAVAAAMAHFGQVRLLSIAGWAFIAGILIFSGSLYALALTGTGMSIWAVSCMASLWGSNRVQLASTRRNHSNARSTPSCLSVTC